LTPNVEVSVHGPRWRQPAIVRMFGINLYHRFLIY
jgi:hypothetical protein